jgi:hypothetical protein
MTLRLLGVVDVWGARQGRPPRFVRALPVLIGLIPVAVMPGVAYRFIIRDRLESTQALFTSAAVVLNGTRGAAANGVEAMQALTLMIVYVLTTFAVQFVGFLVSRLVDYEWPTLGLMTFLILFMGAFGIAWPIAVRITEWLIVRSGHVVETQQSGGDARRDVARKPT